MISFASCAYCTKNKNSQRTDYVYWETNAALSGEQRSPPYLNHCAVNTKAESNRKCRALGIRLKRLVMCKAQTCEINLDE
ncbi:hypothetical protein FKM99_15725 [Vibrio parahaemolyticus]|nr:hypothetical protein FKM99_15725 [Vibrio parahaemolyticus]